MVLLGFFLLFLRQSSSPPAAPAFPKQVRYSFTLRNTANLPAAGNNLWLFAPVPESATQRCSRLTVEQPHAILRDEAGNQFIQLLGAALPPFGSRVVQVDAALMLQAEPRAVPLGPRDRWLSPEKFIESDHPQIRQLAFELSVPDRLRTAERLFAWVSSRMRYSGSIGPRRGALHAIATRAGDCTEFADLFTALCRAAGIPARTVSGFVSRESAVLQAHELHNWSEFYHRGTWHLADPQRGVFRAQAGDYIAMQIISEAAGSPIPGGGRFYSPAAGVAVRMN